MIVQPLLFSEHYKSSALIHIIEICPSFFLHRDDKDCMAWCVRAGAADSSAGPTREGSAGAVRPGPAETESETSWTHTGFWRVPDREAQHFSSLAIARFSKCGSFPGGLLLPVVIIETLSKVFLYRDGKDFMAWCVR